MKSHILTVKRDAHTEELGLVLEDVKVIGYPMAATEGRLIAHDLLEHPNGLKAIGSIGDELEALGGVWYVRGQWDDLNRNTLAGSAITVYENISGDLLTLFEIFNRTHNYRIPVPLTYTNNEDDNFNEIIKQSNKVIREESEYIDLNLELLPQFLNDCLHFIRSGYNKIKNRFYKLDRFRANSLFWAIAEEVDKYIKHIDYEGQQFTLSYCIATCTVTMDEYY